MLDEQELTQVREYVIKILPELLRRDPEVATVIEGILAQEFPRRDEFARLLDEIEQARKERERGWAALHGETADLREEQRRGFTEVRSEIAEARGEVTQLRGEMNERFEQVDQRFEQVDQRFEQVDQRFEQVDQRFEQMDQRFEQVDQRFEQVNQRFEQVDQRFEQVNQRFEQVDQRFEQVNQRFEQTDRSLLELRRGQARLEHGQGVIVERLDGMDAWMRALSGDYGNLKGRTLEDLFAAALRYGLKNPDISAEKLRLRQKLVDKDGRFWQAGQTTEVDLIAEDNRLTAFEIKASADDSDVIAFAKKVEILAAENPGKTVRGIFVTPGASEQVRYACAQFGLELVD